MKAIDLRSDTVTLPTDEMIEAIVAAHKAGRFGDDVSGEDDVVNELQEKAARLLGKEAALLVTSGTQGNLVSLFAQTKRGDEIVVDELSHCYLFEGGAMASFGGLYPHPVKGVRGYITPEILRDSINSDDPHYARTSMVVVENTHNYAGGTVVRPEQVEALAEAAHERDLKVHCDGARLFNAAVALGIPVDSLIRNVDSVMVSLSKGLSAPVGSIVAGTKEFIHEAHRVRKRMGGGMRQAGIIAAPGLIALEKMVSRLKEDHANARLLYEKLSKIPRVVVEEAPETNILFIRLDRMNIDAIRFSEELKKRGVLVYGEYGSRIRFVTHRMVSREDVIRAAQAVENVAKSV